MANGESTKALIGAAGGAGGAGFTGGTPSITSSSQARSQTDTQAKQDFSGWNVYTGGSVNKSGSVPVLWLALGAAAVVGVLWFMNKRKG